MQLRYTPQTKNPHVIGGVDEFDLYVTHIGTCVARNSDHSFTTVHYRNGPTKAKAWQDAARVASGVEMTDEQAERIALMFKLFGPRWEA
jgi:hypothetical protein